MWPLRTWNTSFQTLLVLSFLSNNQPLFWLSCFYRWLGPFSCSFCLTTASKVTTPVFALCFQCFDCVSWGVSPLLLSIWCPVSLLYRNIPFSKIWDILFYYYTENINYILTWNYFSLSMLIIHKFYLFMVSKFLHLMLTSFLNMYYFLCLDDPDLLCLQTQIFCLLQDSLLMKLSIDIYFHWY